MHDALSARAWIRHPNAQQAGDEDLAQSALVTTAPLAFSGSRLHWSDLPREIRARIAELAGADVVTETSATNGFSPGYAALLGLGHGTQVFVKAVSPEQNPVSYTHLT